VLRPSTHFPETGCLQTTRFCLRYLLAQQGLALRLPHPTTVPAPLLLLLGMSRAHPQPVPLVVDYCYGFVPLNGQYIVSCPLFEYATRMLLPEIWPHDVTVLIKPVSFVASTLLIGGPTGNPDPVFPHHPTMDTARPQRLRNAPLSRDALTIAERNDILRQRTEGSHGSESTEERSSTPSEAEETTIPETRTSGVEDATLNLVETLESIPVIQKVDLGDESPDEDVRPPCEMAPTFTYTCC